mmetsp:Transcript_19240/g.54856  ORF Transcript_19240/g.54856 Transcript_19240/m.54856 type:complete len:363 (+) Transcript_19240:76-1164(+)
MDLTARNSGLPRNALARRRARRQHEVPELVDAELEEGLAHAEVVLPHALELRGVGLRVRLEELLRVVAPGRQRLRVVVAEVLEVFHDEEVLHGRHDRGEGRNHRTGEDVGVQEGVARRYEVGLADRMDHRQAVRLEQSLHALEEGGEILVAHVLQHTDAVHAVVGALVLGVLAMVTIVRPNEAQAWLRQVLRGPLDLLLAQTHAGDVKAVIIHVGCGRPPTHAQVDNLHARAGLQLPVDQVELVLLSLVKIACVLPIRAGVRHAGAQHHLVQIVACVVVLLGHARRALPCLHVDHHGGEIVREVQELHDEAEQCAPLLLPAGAHGRAIHQGQEEWQRVHVDLPVHVALRDPEIQLGDDVRPG